MNKWECPRCKIPHHWQRREPKRCRHCGFDRETEAIIDETVKKYSKALRRLAEK